MANWYDNLRRYASEDESRNEAREERDLGYKDYWGGFSTKGKNTDNAAVDAFAHILGAPFVGIAQGVDNIGRGIGDTARGYGRLIEQQFADRDTSRPDPLAQYNQHIDDNVADVQDWHDADFYKDFDFVDKNGEKRSWRVGYKYGTDESGKAVPYQSRIASVYDKASGTDPVYGRDSLREYFKNYFNMDDLPYGAASEDGNYYVTDYGVVNGGSSHPDSSNYGQYSKPMNVKFGPEGMYKYHNNQFNPWDFFPAGWE